MKVITVFLLCISHLAFSQDLGKRLSFNIGTDLYQAQYKAQRYKYDDYGIFKNPTKSISRVAIGANYRITKNYPLYLGFRTNRLINNPAQLKASDIQTNTTVDVHQTFTTDNIYLAGYVNKHIAPFIVVTRLQSKVHFIYSSGVVAKTQYLTMLYGFGLAYTFKQKHALAFTYFLPDTIINTKRAFGFSYSYQIASFFD